MTTPVNPGTVRPDSDGKSWSNPNKGPDGGKTRATPKTGGPSTGFSTPLNPSGPKRIGTGPSAPISNNLGDRRVDPGSGGEGRGGHWGGHGGGHHGGGHHWGGHHGHFGGGSGSNLTIGFGFGAGLSFTANHWFGHHSFVNFSFGSSFCDYDPWYSPSHCWYRPHFGHHHRRFDPFWNCNPWGGFYYSRSCYPLTWCYPGYSWSIHPCGSYYRVSYDRPHCHWLTSFSYCDTPCATFSDCSLISPTVVVDAYEPPIVCWSPTTVYRHSYVPVYAEVTTPSLVTVDTTLPAPASAAELAVTTERELGDTYMKLGDADSAIRVYTAHTARHPGDVIAVRSLGIALIDQAQTERGVEMVERAYRIDPSLARAAFDRELLRDPENLIEVLDRTTALATRLAGQPGESAAWLTVAVLMQADGRQEPAREALEKAKAAGLSSKIVEEMLAAVPVS